MSINGKTVSLKTIVERVYMDFGFNYQLDWVEAAEWAGSLLALLKAPVSLEPKFACIPINDGKGKLPCDLESITACAFVHGTSSIIPNAVTVTENQGGYLMDVVSIDLVNREAIIALSYNEASQLWKHWNNLIPMRYSTDLMHGKSNYHNSNLDMCVNSNYTYKVFSNHIFPNFTKGKIIMAYHAIPVDNEGFPLIPSEEKWRNAVKWEIAYKIATKLWLQGKLAGDRFQFMERDRDWYVAQAGTKTFSIDEMTSLKNSWVRLIPKPHEEDNFFRNMQLPEERYNHPLNRTT